LPPTLASFFPPPVIKLVCQDHLASPREIVVERFPNELCIGLSHFVAEYESSAVCVPVLRR
jgi:hypothetical protein